MLKVWVNCKGKQNVPLSNRHWTERLPESSAEGWGDSRANSKEGRWESTRVSMCYYSGWSRGCLHLGSVVPTQLFWVLKKAFQKTWPYCRNGHHFTVQHLRFSVKEQWDWSSTAQDSDGLLWSVKPEKWTERIVSLISYHFIISARNSCLNQPHDK